MFSIQEIPNDDGKDTSVEDGSLQPSFDIANSAQGLYQEGWHSATEVDAKTGLRATSSVKYRIEKYVNYSKMKGDNLCFATTLNKSVEPTCLKYALSDPNWVEAMNNEIEDLNRNNTWTECDLPFGRKPIRSKWICHVVKMKVSDNRYLIKGQKQSKMDKTEHGNGKSTKN
ncbi:putative reverse transcriptase, RNA-dependent DNA polymerase, LTR copia-type gag-polypeptide [Tanacetum coccineum]